MFKYCIKSLLKERLIPHRVESNTIELTQRQYGYASFAPLIAHSESSKYHRTFATMNGYASFASLKALSTASLISGLEASLNFDPSPIRNRFPFNCFLMAL